MTKRTIEEIARKRTAEELRRVARQIGQRARAVASAMDDSEDVEPNDLTMLREKADELGHVVDDVCFVTDTPRWGTGLSFGELTPEEIEPVLEHDCDPTKHPADWYAEATDEQ